MTTLIERDIKTKLVAFKQSASYTQIAQLITYAFANNYGRSNQEIFGYIPEHFSEIIIDHNLTKDNIFIDQPIIYKIYFPPKKTIAKIPYVYLFCYLKSTSEQLDVYFQSANRYSAPLQEHEYILSTQKIDFQGIFSAFNSDRSAICISDPGHFVPDLHSSYFAGSPEFNFAEFISQILENICHLAQIKLSDTFLFGASAGGVGALLSSTYFSSKVNVMAINSQIDTYSIIRVMRALFGIDDHQTLLKKFGNQVSCLHRFQQNIASIPNIYLLANINDGIYEINYQFYQLYQQLFVSPGKNNQSIFDSYYGEEGHIQPDKVSLKTKLEFARANLTLKLNLLEKEQSEQEAKSRFELKLTEARELQAQGKIELAIAKFQKAIAIQAEYKVINELIDLYKLQKNYDRAAKYYHLFLEHHPKHAHAYVRLGRILVEQKKFIKRSQLIKKLLK